MTDPGTDLPSSALATIDAMPWPKRTWVSVVTAAVGAVLGVGVVGTGAYYLSWAQSRAEMSVPGIVLLVVGAVLLALAAASSRIARTGPLVVGAVCCVFAVVNFFDDHLLWSMADMVGVRSVQFGLLGYGALLLAVVGAMLLGAGLGGQRRPVAGDGGAGQAVRPAGGPTTGPTSGPITEL